jgi:hypothetical protein
MALEERAIFRVEYEVLLGVPAWHLVEQMAAKLRYPSIQL